MKEQVITSLSFRISIALPFPTQGKDDDDAASSRIEAGDTPH